MKKRKATNGQGPLEKIPRKSVPEFKCVGKISHSTNILYGAAFCPVINFEHFFAVCGGDQVHIYKVLTEEEQLAKQSKSGLHLCMCIQDETVCV